MTVESLLVLAFSILFTLFPLYALYYLFKRIAYSRRIRVSRECWVMLLFLVFNLVFILAAFSSLRLEEYGHEERIETRTINNTTVNVTVTVPLYRPTATYPLLYIPLVINFVMIVLYVLLLVSGGWFGL